MPFKCTGTWRPPKCFLNNVNAFRELNQLPVTLPSEGDINVDQFVRHQAQWHLSCHSKFNVNKLERAQKRVSTGFSDTHAADGKQPRQCEPLDKSICLFCRKSDGHLLSSKFMTLKADANVWIMATDLKDTELLSKITGGDQTLTRQCQDSSDSQKQEKQTEARAFVELVTHVEICVEGGQFYFTFSSLYEMFENRLLVFGIHKEINRVRFKKQVVKYFPHAQEQSDGKNGILVFEEGMREVLKQALNCDYEEDLLILAKAAKIVPCDIYNFTGFKLNASFPTECQQNSVPINLKSLVTMMLVRADLKDQSSSDSQDCLTISQTILCNCKKRAPTNKRQHSLEYERPLPLCMGLSVHTQTRSKKVMAQLYELGLSVSYDWVMELENQLATAVCENIAKSGAVCPA
ncbi:hypothetical protein ABVT39_024257 [Epinephelus coioides]